MINKTTLLFLLVFLLLTFGGCVAGQGQIVDMSTLSADEGEKVKPVRLIEAKELDKISYKFIKKIRGLSCEVHPMFNSSKFKNASREEAEEQLKINAVRAGANAISNIVCTAEWSFWTTNRWCVRNIACSADAIKID